MSGNLKLYNLLLTVLCIYSAHGNPSLDRRIVGGTPVEIDKLPYQISLQDKNGHRCGGSIIQKFYILTAAHCVTGVAVKSLSIRAGSKFTNKGGVKISVCSSFIHESFNANRDDYDYDVAILKLCQSLTFNSLALPISLPNFNEIVNPGTPAVVSGWGYTSEHVYEASSLLKTNVVVVNQTQCGNSYRNVGKITNRMICAGCKKGKCDACQGDSGGPLVANGKLVGIVSWGYGCAKKDYPGIYTRVSKIRKWIKNKINY